MLKAVEELDYRPSSLARGLRRSTTCMIGLLIPGNSNPFYAELARAIEDAGFAAGYSVIFIDIRGKASEALERILAENIPVVLTNNDTPLPTIDQVQVDNHQGGYLAGQYLLRLGHRRIGCITLFQPHTYESQRIVGFRKALAEGGIALTEEDFAIGNGRYDSGYQAMQELHHRCPDLTAIFVYNDLMAPGAMNALHAQGKRVPEDLSIIGFDDIFYASAFEPTLTTIAQPITAIGQECMARLLEPIHQPEKPPIHTRLPVELIERASCRFLAVHESIVVQTPSR